METLLIVVFGVCVVLYILDLIFGRR